MKFKVFFNFFNWFKRFVSFKSLFNINIGDKITKVVIVFNFGFLVVAIYISIYYLQEFYYFINLDNISIIENNSDYIVNCNVNNYANDNYAYDNTNKEIYLDNNSKYFKSIDLYGSRTCNSVWNMVTKNSSDNSDRLSIIKYLYIIVLSFLFNRLNTII